MMWIMLVVLAAQYPNSGVATQAVEFQTENACRAAAKEILLVNGNRRNLFVSATCVRKGGN